MSTKPKNKIAFKKLPQDFDGLCALHMPRPIHDKAEYDNVGEIADAMAIHAEEFTDEQEDYFEMLCMVMEAWDAEHVKWKKLTSLKLLAHLLAEHRMSGADLSALLGASRQLGPMILRGDRKITAEHARALGKHFGLPPGVFIE
jgi:HTH-type transcriptional regulator / antitoxin HigA